MSESGFSGINLTKSEVDNLEPFDGDECISFLKDLLYELDDPVHEGITKQVIDRGYESLSDKQKYIFKTYVIQPNAYACGRDEDFSWSESLFVRENGLCSYCQNVWDHD